MKTLRDPAKLSHRVARVDVDNKADNIYYVNLIFISPSTGSQSNRHHPAGFCFRNFRGSK